MKKKYLQTRKEILNAAKEIKNVYLHLPFSIHSVTKHTHSKTARSQIELKIIKEIGKWDIIILVMNE